MQLVAYGAQDIYLTGNPQITFFKVVYRRHTNFSMETIQQTINGASTTAGGNGTVTISRNGDLVSSVYITSSTPGIQQGTHMVSKVEVEIGGQMIDRQYEEWNDVWNELSTPASKAAGLKCMTCDAGTSGQTAADGKDVGGVGMVQLPLNFWFCRNPGLALPLIALQYHEVKLKITWGTKANVGEVAACKVWCDYIYLDTDERRRFAQVSHEYLIEQVQRQTAAASSSQKLHFNHPVKELIWTSATANSYTDAKLVLNGHDRFAAQEEEYFQLRQPYQYHTAMPNQNLPSVAAFSDSAHPVNIFTGTNINSDKVTAESFADTLVTPGKVMLSTGGVTTALSGKTATKTKNETVSEEIMIYSFLTSDLAITPVVNDKVTITIHGSQSRTHTAVAHQVTCRISQVHVGALALGLTNTGNTHIQLDKRLTLVNVTQEINSGAKFTINHFRIEKGEIGIASTSKMTKKINVYSFALKPEEHQPSGTCNFSRIDNAKLNTTGLLGTTDNIYAVNYNVLRIMSGMGGLAYSN